MNRPYGLIDAIMLSAPIVVFTGIFLYDALGRITTWRGPLGLMIAVGGLLMLVRVWSLLWAVP